MMVNAWVAPGQVRAPIVRAEVRRTQQAVFHSERNELVAYRQG
jgi:hypothetical protein